MFIKSKFDHLEQWLLQAEHEALEKYQSFYHVIIIAKPVKHGNTDHFFV